MNTFFHKKHCSDCGANYDSTRFNCPKCGKENEDLGGRDIFQNDLQTGSPLRNLFLFLMGLAGFQILGFLVSYFVQVDFVRNYMAANPGADTEALSEAWVEHYKANPGIGLFINGVAYILVLACLLLILWSGIKELGKSFTKLKNVGYGALGGLGVLAASIVIGMIVHIIRPDTTANENQSGLVLMSKNYMVFALIIFGLVGPICEELTYRVGLYSFTKRWNRTAAYIITPIVFGLIHFNWESLTIGGNTLVNELCNLPDYIVAGVLFSYYYEKGGFACSATAHVVNNLVALSISAMQASNS